MKPYYELLIEKIKEMALKEEPNLDKIEKVLLNSKKNNKKIYLIGNGGSASSAEHIQNDFENIAGLKAETLTNTSIITAYGNDRGYEFIFMNQLKYKMEPGDVLIAITGSGNSLNIIKALEYANTKGITIGFLGFDGGKAKNISNYNIIIPSDNYGIIEDLHLTLGHYFSQKLKKIKEDSPKQEIALSREALEKAGFKKGDELEEIAEEGIIILKKKKFY